MLKYLMLSFTLILYLQSFCQNVGVGTASPSEKLDVNGNLNVTGTIKANGVDGTAGQVLMKNAGGTLSWADLSSYKNFETFFTPGAGNWTVPAGVTKIFVEAWGAGGGGSAYGGGGGGGYVCAYLNVSAGGTVAFNIGNNGIGGNSGSTVATSGGNTTASSGGITLTAYGGSGSIIYDATPPYGVYGGSGGGFGASGSFRNFYGSPGEDGQPNQLQYFQSNATTYLEATLGGKGGNAGNSENTGANGGYTLYSVTAGAQLRYISTGNSAVPGGGGGGNFFSGVNFGGAGADGMVVIRY
jgi:hypothetical protein